MNSPRVGPGDSAGSSNQDANLLHECLLGNEAAWSTLIRKYANLIFSIPLKQGFSQSEAADVFQSVCLALLRSLGSLREPHALPAWLIRTTAHTCSKMVAQRRKSSELEMEELYAITPHPDLPDDTIEQIEREQLVRETVSGLSAECRELIQFLFFTDPPLPYETAAAQLGLAKGSIGATRMRCLERLRRSLKEKGFR